MKFLLKKRFLIIASLLSTTIAIAAWVGAEDETQAKPNQRRLVAVNTPVPEELDISLDKLKRAPDSPQQDIFNGKSWYVPPPPPKAELNPVNPIPPLPFVYMGKLQEQSGKVIIYLTRGDNAYIVKEGDVLDQDYRVEKIESGKITLTYLPMSTTQTLQFGADYE